MVANNGSVSRYMSFWKLESFQTMDDRRLVLMSLWDTYQPMKDIQLNTEPLFAWTGVDKYTAGTARCSISGVQTDHWDKTMAALEVRGRRIMRYKMFGSHS